MDLTAFEKELDCLFFTFDTDLSENLDMGEFSEFCSAFLQCCSEDLRTTSRFGLLDQWKFDVAQLPAADQIFKDIVCNRKSLFCQGYNQARNEMHSYMILQRSLDKLADLPPVRQEFVKKSHEMETLRRDISSAWISEVESLVPEINFECFKSDKKIYLFEI
jgi:hypothetical protein